MAFGEQFEAIPSQYRWAMIPGIIVLLGVVYWYFLYQPWAEEVARLDRQITEKSRTLEEHRRIAATYDEFKVKVEELEDKLRLALVRLPERKEIPDLIRQISDLGVGTGLQVSLLRPQAEQPKEFYAEVPITVKVLGTYHAVGQFFDALGRLTRLVSVSNVQMLLNSNVLETQCLATTFRFFEEGEESAPKGG